MVATCANPSCSASFRFLQEGKLFLLEPDPKSTSTVNAYASSHARMEYFWLCSRCSEYEKDCENDRVMPPSGSVAVPGCASIGTSCASLCARDAVRHRVQNLDSTRLLLAASSGVRHHACDAQCWSDESGHPPNHSD